MRPRRSGRVKVLIALRHPFSLWNAPGWLGPRLRSEFPDIDFAQIADYDSMGDAIVDAEVAIAWSVRPADFARAKKLKWIHSTAAAVHQLIYPEMVASKVVITNARNVHAPVVAEHALAVVFALAKRLPTAFEFQKKKRWAQQQIWEERPTIREIEGSTVVLVGMGSIGREFTSRAKVLGMNVVAVREHPEQGTGGADEVISHNALQAVLPRADFVVLAAPLTEKTRHIINASSLAAMQSSAYLINVARGPLIDDGALIAALKARSIAGAALDVFEHEPLPADSLYWALPNVLITPHTAAITEKLWERQYALIAQNLRNYIVNAPLENIVDKCKGY